MSSSSHRDGADDPLDPQPLSSFCSVFLDGRQLVTTDVISDECSPRWDKALEFRVNPALQQTLRFEVRNFHSMSRSSLVGWLELPAAEFSVLAPSAAVKTCPVVRHSLIMSSPHEQGGDEQPPPPPREGEDLRFGRETPRSRASPGP